MTPGRRLAITLIVLLGVVTVGAAGYIVLEHLSLLDALFMTLVTVSTVGMASADLAAKLDAAGKAWTILLIFFGIGTVTIAFTNLLAMAAGGEIRRILGRRHLNARIAAMRNHIIICGFGRVGQTVCRDLQSADRPFVMGDKDPNATAFAEKLGYIYQLGDASLEQTLKEAGIEHARALVTVLPSDAENVYVTLTARGMNPGVVIVARAEQQTTISKLQRAGASRVISPHMLGARRITEVLVRPAVVDFFEMASAGVDLEMDQVQVAAGSELIGKDLRAARLRDRFHVMVVAIRRSDGQTLYNPEPGVTLAASDMLVVIGPAGASANMRRLQQVGLEAGPPPTSEE
ncbi:MAG: Glutathione-regulated potassium-efflux system protein KefC [Phycisphaerae bacterium]|nr:Glutathione-regulated potassium-efflux system protein KefC [Phycisphaerae bacterium]